MKNGQKSIRLNPINYETSNWIIPTLDSFGLILIENSIWINSRSYRFRFIRSDVSELIGLSRINFWTFFIKRDTKRFSDWFGMIRVGSDTDIEINRNSFDWLGMNFLTAFRWFQEQNCFVGCIKLYGLNLLFIWPNSFAWVIQSLCSNSFINLTKNVFILLQYKIFGSIQQILFLLAQQSYLTVWNTCLVESEKKLLLNYQNIFNQKIALNQLNILLSV